MLHLNYDQSCLQGRKYNYIKTRLERDYIDNENKKRGLWPINKELMEQNCRKSLLDGSHRILGKNEEFITEDILIYLYNENLLCSNALVNYSLSNHNVGLDFAKWFVDEIGLQPRFCEIESWKKVRFEQMHNLVTLYPNIISMNTAYYKRPINPREKYFHDKLTEIGFVFFKKRHAWDTPGYRNLSVYFMDLHGHNKTCMNIQVSKN